LTTTGRGTVPAGTGAVTIAPTPVTPVKKQALTPEQLRRRRAAIERVIRNPCTPAPLSGHAAKPKR
jgi:hypothetical protein